MPERKLPKIFNMITDWVRSAKTGSLTINFFKGGISNVIAKESFKIDP